MFVSNEQRARAVFATLEIVRRNPLTLVQAQLRAKESANPLRTGRTRKLPYDVSTSAPISTAKLYAH